ncbi:hypothetical protein BKA70DRAFT_1063144, partial [Coprinopsis sp. MPI-PUGE-AT-0042]
DDEDEYDRLFPDEDVFMNIDLPEDSALNAESAHLMEKFEQALNEIKLRACRVCNEESFDKQPEDGVCVSCVNEAKKAARTAGDADSDIDTEVKKWSFENNTQPAFDVPMCLQNLTETEEILIARVKPIMAVHYTSG